jgi:hypothetical protein
LVVPRLLSSSGGRSASLQNPQTNESQTLSVGATAWGWELSSIMSDGTTAVLEHDFDNWAQIAFVSVKQGVLRTVSKPVGRVDQIQQAMYAFDDAEYACKQDVDPTDYLGNIASNLSDGEPTIAASIRLMAPNPDSGLLGNPEESNKFILTDGSTLLSTPWVTDRHAKNTSRCSSQKGRNLLWSLADYLPTGCTASSKGTKFANQLTGMVGPLRAVNREWLRVLPAGIAAWGSRETLPATLRCSRLASNASLNLFRRRGPVECREWQ